MLHRYTLPILALCSITVPASAQGVATGILDNTNVQALFHSNGLIGEDLQTSRPHFYVPWIGGVSPLYSAGLWVAGMAPDNSLHVAAQLYDAVGYDLAPGPLTLGSASITPQTSFAYDRVWKISRAQVEQHQAYFNCLSDINCDVDVDFPGYVTPMELYGWPAMGDVAAGQAPYLAPFNDYNADGNYDPDDGDTPCVPGDEALFMLFNDKTAPHTMSMGQPLGLEVHMTPFGYYGLNDVDIRRTVFVRYRIINRSSTPYHDCYIGLFNDFDLGCSDDDFIGTDVGRNLVYVYNWDEDDQSCQSGIPGYGPAPPAFGMTVLKGPLLDANNADDAAAYTLPSWNGTGFGDGNIDNERTGLSGSMFFSREGNNNVNDPDQAVHFYNYLRSMWKDGTPQSYGGTGYSTSPNARRSLYIFPNDSDPLGVGSEGEPQPAWVESAQVSPDRRILGNMGPFSLDAGEEDEIVVAYVYARAGNRLASLAALKQTVDSVRAFAEATPEVLGPVACAALPPQGIYEHAAAQPLQLFPNPAMDRIGFTLPNANGGDVRVFDATGRLVLTQRITTAQVQLDVHALPAASYVVRVQTRDGLRYGRFVRQ
ncbi:MAG TPA: T9SS type A sorting domain-containing protein [Flavobacteriales bacterium]|jgi:hypothetical protein|nr:T9SS type A sorting domain-containing protein [Flavobacteriales bacterium]